VLFSAGVDRALPDWDCAPRGVVDALVPAFDKRAQASACGDPGFVA
jgi:hypothetical protein